MLRFQIAADDAGSISEAYSIVETTWDPSDGGFHTGKLVGLHPEGSQVSSCLIALLMSQSFNRVQTCRFQSREIAKYYSDCG